MPLYLKLPFSSGNTSLPILDLNSPAQIIAGIPGIVHWLNGQYGRTNTNTLLDRISGLNGKIEEVPLPGIFNSARFGNKSLMDFTGSPVPKLLMPEKRVTHFAAATFIVMFELANLDGGNGQLVYSVDAPGSSGVYSQIRFNPASGAVGFAPAGLSSVINGSVGTPVINTLYYLAMSVSYTGLSRHARVYANTLTPAETTTDVAISPSDTDGDLVHFGVGPQVSGQNNARISDAFYFDQELSVENIALVINTLKSIYGVA